MSSVTKANRDYLKSLVDQISEIPTQTALETGHNLLLKLVSYTAVDTGQAALNWTMLPYKQTYNLGQQKILWGSAPDYANPHYPVLSKKGEGRNDVASLIDYVNGVANYVINSAPKRISGVVVYNPISPGFLPFDDSEYESNALSLAEQQWQDSFHEALSEAEANMKTKFRALV